MATSYHVVHYRHLESTDKTINLEASLRAAFNTTGQTQEALWMRIGDRLYNLPNDKDERSLLVNRASDLTSAVFGEICLIQKHDLQAMLKLQESVLKISATTTVKAYDLEDREAPSGLKFIRGMAYWMVIKNHLFFVKTQAMGAELIASYFDWLLKDRTGVMAPSIAFMLQAQIDQSAVSGDLGEIRSLKVKTSSGTKLKIIPDEADEVKFTETDYSKHVKSSTVADGTALSIFENIFGSKQAESLAESLGPKEELIADTSFRIKGRRTNESRKRMKDIVNAAADTDLGEIRVEGKDFKMSHGDAILRTTMPFDQPYDGSNLLEFDNVADQLTKVYKRFVEDGKIKA
ncbi:hypothetical protein [Asticcacaulis sp.]|uniref:hypothetical protein n=1 Tax=Asticcacaulis sp. TaxID=1872648 RepID=UPI0026312DDE|nr:hypothetical protein [Asticcacaulis sp.]